MNNEKQFSGYLFSVVNARNIVFVAMLAVGLLCIIMSGRNTASYLMLTGMDSLLAIMTGTALIIFSATSFTSAQLFLAQNGAAKLFSIFFIVIGMTVITFSIFSTLSLNYSRFVNSEAIQDDIADQIERRRSQIMAEYQAAMEIGIETGMAEQDVVQWTMQNMERLLSMAEQQGMSWNNSMRTVMETTQILADTEQQRRQNTEENRQQGLDELLQNIYVETIPRTFFGFMLGLHTLDRKYFFDFFMIATPAVFYDIIAPLSITVVLFLLGFKKKDQPAPAKPEPKKIVEKPVRREKPVETKPDLTEVTIYIDSALQDDYSLLPDDAIGNIEDRQCKQFREYLMTFIYKNNSIITEKDGRFISTFDKKNLKRFIELQYNVQRKGD
jgi:hypothetical protein